MEATGNNIGTQLVFQPHMDSALCIPGNISKVSVVNRMGPHL